MRIQKYPTFLNVLCPNDLGIEHQIENGNVAAGSK